MKGLAPQTSAIFDSISKMDCIKPFVLVGSTAYARYDFNHTVLFFVNHLFQVSVSFDYHIQTNFVQSNVFRLQ